MNLNQIAGWYGAPGLRAASGSRTDTTLIGVSEENLLMAASFLSRGQSVALTSGPVAHRVVPHPSNSRVSHEDFYRALGITPPAVSEAEVWNDRGDKLFVLGWKLECLECFFRALSIDSNCTSAWVNLGRYFMDPQIQDLSAAALCAEKALEVDERCDMALANLGGIAFARRDPSRVIHYCSRAVAINNNNFFAHYYLAGALTQAGDYTTEKQRQILQHALRCRDLIDQCPQAAPTVEQMIAWCRGK